MTPTKTLVLLTTLFVLLSCQTNDKKQGSTGSSKNVVRTDSLQEQFKESSYFGEERVKTDKFNVKFKGDWGSYADLELYYQYNKLRKEELLPYGIIIVEKHKQYRFCSDVFLDFLAFYSGEENTYDGTEESAIIYLAHLKKLNDEQRNYLLHFLKLGSANSDKGSNVFLERLYRNGIGVEKNIQKADSLKAVITAKSLE